MRRLRRPRASGLRQLRREHAPRSRNCGVKPGEALEEGLHAANEGAERAVVGEGEWVHHPAHILLSRLPPEASQALNRLVCC